MKTTYPNLDLYKAYRERLVLQDFSSALPDVTCRVTLGSMNVAINLCEQWDYCIDIGGGSGHYAAAMASRFKDVLLLEPEEWSEHKILLARHNNLSIENSYVETFSQDKKADFILLADVYEHIPDIEAFVSRVSDLQNLGGVVYILTPNPLRCGPASESALYYTKRKDGHIKHYTSNEIKASMSSAGYVLETILYEEGPWRQMVKRIIFAISRRDKRWSKRAVYKILRPIILFFAKGLFVFFDATVFWSEKKYQADPLINISQGLVFKKISNEKLSQ